MKKHLNIAIALGAGLLGGVLSRSIELPAAKAQNLPPVLPIPPSVLQPAEKEFRAQKFTLVDAKGRTAGTFMFSTERGRIVLLDPMQKEIWSAGGNPIRPLSER